MIDRYALSKALAVIFRLPASPNDSTPTRRFDRSALGNTNINSVMHHALLS